LAGLADARGEAGLDVHVDVFQRGVEGELAGLDLGGDVGQAAANLPLVGGGDDPHLRQHGGVRQRAPDVLAPQLAVEADGGIDLLHHHRGPAAKRPPHCMLASLARRSGLSLKRGVLSGCVA